MPLRPEPMPELQGASVTLRLVEAVHRDDLRRIIAEPGVARWWGEPDSTEWPMDGDEDEARYAVLMGSTVVGLIQYGEEPDPHYRHASVDIMLDPLVHGRGYGRDAIRTLVRHLIEGRGHHRVVIDPAAGNARAIAVYSSVGFRPVGVLRRYERNTDGSGWHDGLLMDLLAGELE